MTLTNVEVKNAKSRDKDYKLADAKGMFLLVKKNGSKYWRLKYRFGGKEKVLALGVYGPDDDDVSLSEARNSRAVAREQIKNGIDPGLERKKKKLAIRTSVANTFESVAEDWIRARSKEGTQKQWSARHAFDVEHTLNRDIYPYIGKMPIIEIDVQSLRGVLEKIVDRGAFETASRLRQRCSAVFRHGIALALCDADPAENLKGIVNRPKSKNMPSLDAKEFPVFLRAVDGYQGERLTCIAMRLMMLTFVRTSELIGGRWDEIDFQQKMWNIPPERMKRDRAHFVPLAKQTLVVLEELHELTGAGELMFPRWGKVKSSNSMSNGTILRVIDRLGYRNRMSGHGFRSMASTALNESQIFSYDSIEKQLSHDDDNDVRAAYNKAKYMPERKKLMQWWADHLDQLTTDADVIDVNRSKIPSNLA